MARLLTTGLEAENVGWFCLVGAIFGVALPIFQLFFPNRANYLPSGKR